MILKQIKGQHFRNYSSFVFSPSPTNTIVVGDNGSGKTSLLEAIYLLGSGKSFRTSRLQHLLSRGAEVFYLHAQVQVHGVLHSLGVARERRAFTTLRLNGENISSLSTLAKVFPVQVFHSESTEIIYGAAEIRRRFLDWGLFHVEHEFHGLWKNLNKVLRQRNELLKQVHLNPEEIKVWDEQLVQISDKITGLRRKHLEHVEARFQALLGGVLGELDVRLVLHTGWPEGVDLSQGLKESFEVDRQRGFTSRGAHRADIRITVDGVIAKEALSRGQIKTLSMLLGLAQLEYLVEEKQLQPVVLVDDMAAELDADHMGWLVEKLSQLNQQVIYTALTLEGLPRTLVDAQGSKVFHVEQGELKECVQTEANINEGNNDARE